MMKAEKVGRPGQERRKDRRRVEGGEGRGGGWGLKMFTGSYPVLQQVSQLNGVSYYSLRFTNKCLPN